jgi:hypothetical protein
VSGSVNPITHAWFTGVAAVGTKVETAPMQFTQPVVMQGGMATQVNGAALPVITAPGTVASAGTVTNTTGFDAMVYASATSGITKVVFPGISAGTIAGTTAPGITVPIYWPNNQGVAVSYNGTLTWTWLAI